MPRPPDTPGQPRNVPVTVKLTQAGVERLDRMRGDLSRAAFIRQLLRQAAANGR